jgi:hypothetical protein
MMGKTHSFSLVRKLSAGPACSGVPFASQIVEPFFLRERHFRRVTRQDFPKIVEL